MINLNNQTAIVTGAGRGIGKSIALSLARERMNIVLAARTKSELESAAIEVKNLGGNPHVVITDLCEENEIKQLIRETMAKFGRVDVLINNAGIGYFSPVEELSVEHFDRMFNVNMRGVYLCTREVLPHMMKERSGAIINISSLAGKNFFKGGAGYSASKWALMGFSKCLMLEAREYNIRVSVICPGSVVTEFSSHGGRDPGKLLHPQNVADAVLSVLKLPANALISEIDLRPTNPK